MITKPKAAITTLKPMSRAILTLTFMAHLRKESARHSNSRDELARAPIERRVRAAAAEHRASCGAPAVLRQSCRDRPGTRLAPPRRGVARRGRSRYRSRLRAPRNAADRRNPG